MKLFADINGTHQLVEVDIDRKDFGFVMNHNLLNVELKSDRSFDIEIPATTNNDYIFRIPYREDLDATSMLNETYAEVHYSGGIVSGTLRITKADRNKYNATFYYGNDTNGYDVNAKIAGILEPSDFANTDWVNWQSSNPSNYRAGGGASIPSYKFALFRYHVKHFNQQIPPTGEQVSLMPSVFVKYLIDLCTSKIGIGVNFAIEDPAKMAKVVDRYNRLMIKLNTHYGSTSSTTYTDYEWGVAGHDGQGMDAGFLSVFSTPFVAIRYYSGTDIDGAESVQVFQAKYDTTVTIDNLYGSRDGINPITDFVYTVNDSGWNSIAVGDTITLAKGDFFIVADGKDGTYPTQEDIRFGSNTPGVNYGWYIEVSYRKLEETGVDNPQYPRLYLCDNLPDVTLAELMKTVAWSLGLAMCYDGNNREFILSDNLGTSYVQLPPVTGIPSVSVGSNSMNGTIDFKSSDYSLPKLTEQIGEGGSTLFTIPFSEERYATYSPFDTNLDVLIDDISYSDGYEYCKNSKNAVLCLYNTTPPYLRRIDLFGSAIADLSTQMSVTVKCIQNTYGFMSMKPTDIILWKGRSWIIRQAKNSGGVTEFELVKRND